MTAGPPVPAPLVNGWENMGAPYAGAGYYKDALGIVHLQGVVKNGPVPSLMFTLPEGFRPVDGAETFAVTSQGAFGEITVLPSGTVYVMSGAAVGVPLSGITFRGG